ncbi:hypothetical protein CAL7716_085240 [Calothrix sp. PCC 7716]|nr:hypothetical protein CAL7716_085240 [Calothrix sp. PCC 7716]
MLKIDNLVINLGAIAYVDLSATKGLVSRDVNGVRIYFTATDSEGNLCSCFFSGNQADRLRKYFSNEHMEEC